MQNNNSMKRPLSEEELATVAGGAGGGAISSGTFRSDSGTNLNIVVNWSVNADSMGGKKLDLVVSTDSYSLYTQALAEGVTVTVNGMPYTASALAISYDGAAKALNKLAEFSIPNFPGTATVVATWHFNGSYSGAGIRDIVATGMVTG